MGILGRSPEYRNIMCPMEVWWGDPERPGRALLHASAPWTGREDSLLPAEVMAPGPSPWPQNPSWQGLQGRPPPQSESPQQSLPQGCPPACKASVHMSSALGCPPSSSLGPRVHPVCCQTCPGGTEGTLRSKTQGTGEHQTAKSHTELG